MPRLEIRFQEEADQAVLVDAIEHGICGCLVILHMKDGTRIDIDLEAASEGPNQTVYLHSALGRYYDLATIDWIEVP